MRCHLHFVTEHVMLSSDERDKKLESCGFPKLTDLLKIKLGVCPYLKMIFGVCKKYILNFMLFSRAPNTSILVLSAAVLKIPKYL